MILQGTLAVRPAGGVVILSRRGSVALAVILGATGERSRAAALLIPSAVP